MRQERRRFLFFIFALFITFQALPSGIITFQQDTVTAPNDWILRDPSADYLQGVSVERTYATLLKDKPSKTVVVAVIDSGVDPDHEDLKDVMWTNPKEIAGNGIDDDKNGYTDDVHGWNFIGGKNGSVTDDSNEVTREYKRLIAKYGTVDENKVSAKNKAEYAYWKKIKKKYENDSKFNADQYEGYRDAVEKYDQIQQTLAFCDSVIKKTLQIDRVTKADVERTQPKNDTVAYAKGTLQKVYENVSDSVDMNTLLQQLSEEVVSLKEGMAHFKATVDYTYNLEYDARKIVGDNYANVNEKFYGNPDVKGGNAFHGTHVAGIIAANRKNAVGIKGIADNVRIMSVRVVPPGGDERDKDIANAITYAVDNGARIINMSFGKAFSPNKAAIDKAVHYAESKNVLLIHAAGNDGDDNDTDENYPNRYYLDGKEAKNWLEIGASSWGTGKDFVASFSNYGKKSVDFFSPGVQVYSTIPGNKYEKADGTSMASPVTTGIAAILLSYFPDLTATQLRDILRQSTRRFDNLQVTKPGTKDSVNFSTLSNTGGLVNAFEAVKLAMTMKGQQVEK